MIGKQKIRRKLHGIKCVKCTYYLGKIKCVTDPCIECVSSNRKKNPFTDKEKLVTVKEK